MRRRDFIAGIAGSAALPRAARGQERGRVRRIGVLLPATADNADYQGWFGAFLQGLQQAGWTIGRNVRIDTRWVGTRRYKCSESLADSGCSAFRCVWRV
jgi:putative tryptophan/tyrosine transport system substrate-binding protein